MTKCLDSAKYWIIYVTSYLNHFVHSVPKKFTFCNGLISQKKRYGFPNPFCHLETDIHMQMLNTDLFLCDFRGLKMLLNKIRL